MATTCNKCGKYLVNTRAGSFTSFLFQELRCQCPQSALPKKERLARTNTQVRRQAMAEKRGYTANLKANAESARNLPPADLPVGTIFGGAFKIISVIGEGGMGIVYLAQHLSLNQAYALKVLSPSIVSEQSWLRFKAEAKTLSVLNHPGLVKVYDLGIHENTVPYYSMDYLKGETLEDLLVRKGPQKFDYTISIFLPVLDALAYAHRNNVVHRDIKPANIFICQNQEIKILDFGISKLVGDKHSQRNQELTAIGEVFGSPYYMSPEQCRGEQIDFRSDIYSVGCTLFETLTGCVPFESANSLEIAMLHEEGEIPTLSDVCDISLPPSFDVVIAKCLAKSPRDRYQSAKEMAIDLTRIKEGKSLAAYGRAARLEKTESMAVEAEPHGGRLVYFSILAILALGLAGGIAYFMIDNKSEAPLSQARVKPTFLSQDPLKSSSSRPTVNDSSEPVAKELYSQADESAVQAYLKTAPKYYSQIVSKNGRKVKVFTFPSAFSLGEVICSFSGKSYTYEAQEKLGVPLTADVSLTSRSSLQHNPVLLSHFRGDDLHSLTFIAQPDSAEQVLPYLSRLTSLRSIALQGIPLDPENIKFLNGLTNLQSLTLLQCHADLATLLNLLPLRSVERIHLDGGANLSALLKVFSLNPHLLSLELTEAQLSKADISVIASLRSLENLSIESSSISNEDLEALTALPNLSSLNLRDCTADEKCVKSLLKFSKLKSLTLRSVEMPLAQQDQLQTAIPTLTVMRFAGDGVALPPEAL